MALDVYKEWLGIPEGDCPPNHYVLLRVVKFEDDVEKIRKNYTKLNTHVRKFASGQYSVQSQDLLNELAKAMLCLTDPDRKHDYDESQGREFEEETGFLGRKSLGDYLVSQGVLSRIQAKGVEAFADARGLSMRDAVVQMKLVDTETAAQAFAQELGLSYVDLSQMLPDDSVLDKIPRNIVKRNSILPLFIDDDVLLVAGVYEPSPELEEELRLRVGVPMRGVIATPLAINQGIAKYYAQGMREESQSEETPEKTAKSAKQAKSEKTKSKRSEKTQKEKDQAKKNKILISGMIVGWSIIGSVVLDQTILKSFTGVDFPYFSTLFVPPIVAAIVFLVWKFQK